MHVDDAPVPGLDATGRPDPAYAASLGLRPAPTGRRAAAFALDAAAYVVVASPAVVGAVLLANAVVGADAATVVDPSAPAGPLVLIGIGQLLVTVFGLTQLALHGRRGVTLGKRTLGLRSVQVADFGRPGFWRVVLRVLVLWASQVVLPLVGPAVMFGSGLWDPEQRGRSWLDRVGRCWVVDVRHGLDPFDLKALRHARRAVEAPAVADAPKLPSLASDRPVGEGPFIPVARSSSGVVSAAPSVDAPWSPPELAPAGGRGGGAAHPGAAQPGGVRAGAAPTAARPAAAQPGGVASAESWVLVFDDGSRIVAASSGLLGRGPAPAPGEEADQLVPLIDESMRISKTHAAYGIDDGALWIADRGSKNGSVVTLPDGDRRPLVPGVRTPLPAGATVTIGGRSFTVSHDTGARR